MKAEKSSKNMNKKSPEMAESNLNAQTTPTNNLNDMNKMFAVDKKTPNQWSITSFECQQIYTCDDFTVKVIHICFEKSFIQKPKKSKRIQ